MDIYAKKGHKVKYTGCSDTQRSYGGHDDPRGKLVEGEIYTVEHTNVDNWCTEVYLEEFPGLEFNSVCFEDA